MTEEGSGSIELEGITKRYGETAVVAEVSAAIRPGEFFSLLGPSGSGKTTTLMMIAGFVAANEGRILCDGTDITAVPPQRRGFGMVFQNYAIFPHLSVYENVAFPLKVRRLGRAEITQRVDRALDLVKLTDFSGRNPRQLSGGQQQRVALARAIVFHPRIVLMDEPLGALDKNLRYHMQMEIKEIQQRLGMTVVYVTHDQEEAMNMSDRIAIMNEGRVVQSGPPAEVYERPATAFTGRFLGEANLLPVIVSGRDGDGCALVHCRDVTLAGLATEKAGDGDPALLFVRPEKIRLGAGDAAQADDNRLAGRVRRVSYLGNIIRYMVDTGHGEPVTVDAQNVTGTPAYRAGEAVVMSWARDDCRLLAPEG